MERHVDEQLPEYLLGTLPPEHREAVERHMTDCAACARLQEHLRRSTEVLAAAVTPRAPPPQARERLLSFVRGEGRFADFVPAVARLFDLEPDAARRCLARLREPEAWLEGPVPGVTLLPVACGPRLEGAFAAFVKLAPGSTFPPHTHGGQEKNLVLQGGFREDSGHEVWPGECLEKSPGTTHAYVALEGPDCIAASVVHGEIRLEDEER